MYVNIDAVPPGHHMFTIHVGKSLEMLDEVDITVKPGSTSGHTVEAVMLAAHDALQDYEGSQVYGIVDQSDGYVVFDSRTEWNRPLPLAIDEEKFGAERPYLYLLDVMHDGDESYLDHLYGRIK